MNGSLMERPVDVTSEQLELVRRTVAAGATDAELKLFLFDCQRRGVHPLDKLLHFTKRGGKYTPVTSIDFMRSQAAMSGEMAGSDDPDFHDTEPGDVNFHASVTVYRMTQGQRFGYSATARWAEYCPDNAPMWRRMPHTMLGKCAEALALRKAFPQQLAGLYSREEMDQAGDSGPALSAAFPASNGDVNKETGEEAPTVSGEFAAWRAGLEAVAEEGQKAFDAAWEASPIEHRNTLLSVDRVGWTALKAKARAVKK